MGLGPREDKCSHISHFTLQASGRRSPEPCSKPEKILKRGAYDKVGGGGGMCNKVGVGGGQLPEDDVGMTTGWGGGWGVRVLEGRVTY